jgi:HNH endonuclease
VAAEFVGLAADQFWLHVRKTEGCWLWTGPTNGRYGRVGRRTYAHRVSYELEHGPIPDGLFVMHNCDTPLCVRPDHLRVGTAKENTQDAVAKRRMATGERHGTKTHPETVARGARHGTKTHPERINRGEDRPQSKLTEEDVRQIRQLAALGETRALLARRYGVTSTVIRRIAEGTSWRHVR